MRLFGIVFYLTVIIVLYFASLDLKESKSADLTNENIVTVESVTSAFKDELANLDTLGDYEDEIYSMISNFSELFGILNIDIEVAE